MRTPTIDARSESKKNRPAAVLNDIRFWFLEYAAGYGQGDPDQHYHFELKRRHSLRVCAQMKHLARELGLSSPEIDTARIIGLLHDVGRFEQYARFRTYADSVSLDHAAAGADIIQSKGILADLSPDLQEQIICAIRYHNKAAIPAELSGRRRFWARMIRDGDKLDIWRVILSDYCRTARKEPDVTGLFSCYPRNPDISGPVYQAVLNTTTVDLAEVVTLNDVKLMQMAWIFDLNFKPSFHMVRRRGYLKKIYATMPPDPKIKSAYDHILSYLNSAARV